MRVHKRSEGEGWRREEGAGGGKVDERNGGREGWRKNVDGGGEGRRMQ